MPKYKLIYFNGKARGETARMLFHLNGVSFEDQRIDFDKWPAIKPNTPFGSLPVLEVDGVQIGQTRAIERFLAKRFGMYGSSDVGQARIDMMVDASNDIIETMIKIRFNTPIDEKEAAKASFKKEKAATILRNLEKYLSDDGYCLGKEFTLADIAIYSAIVDAPPMAGIDLSLENFPKLQKLKYNVENNEKLAAYFKTRPEAMF